MSSLLSSLPTYSTTSNSRLQSLYSDISRQKYSNPTSYHSNVDWWGRTLETLVTRGWLVENTTSTRPSSGPGTNEIVGKETDKLILNAGRGLVESLRYEGVGKPLGLGTVIAELRSTKSLIPLSQFLYTTQSVYDPGWLPYRIASYVLGKPLWWALEQLELVRPEDGYSETEMWKRVAGQYIVLGLVEKAAHAVVRIREANRGIGAADGLFNFEGFRKEFGDKVNAGNILSEGDVKVLVKFLERDRKVVVVDKEVIKFVDEGQIAEITAVDRGILELKTAVENLHAQVDSIQRKIDDCTEKIQSALRQKRKSIALSYLRSKKQLEDLLTKRLGSLETLQSTLIRVEGAAGDVEIMKSYESSTATLQMILAHPSLQRDKIDETMDAMASATSDARDVDEAIKIGGDIAAADAGIDESELEEELRALVKESERDREDEAEKEQRARLEEERMKVPEQRPDAVDPREPSKEVREAVHAI
ncbi:hypothetical protein PILCRDRAFT_815664 [Piloderma croceum F 1598]|uniref:Charged multivesicular body protein 7 n=1 Tax=Piloderma croceum (strain F 1598) TaxID=765440 RepID=A0A0C3G5Y6_PILCF|nr:hypothetical protein PILCRDRAFT_815664 [Piloderma croceum F 1598]